MNISFENITLRDYILSDIEDEIRWTNIETEWFCTEAPWMTLEAVDEEELRADMMEVISHVSENAIRWHFEIDVDGKHIGNASSYYLDQNWENTPWDSIDPSKNAPENHSVRALGIEICDKSYWGKGVGAKVLTMMMDYYRGFGEDCFLLETWSGHQRMLACAKKLGFYEVKRDLAAHTVEGTAYDDLILEKRF